MTDNDPASSEPLSLATPVKLIRKMGHDMRGPLAAILGSADLLAMGDDLTPKHKRATERIQRNSARLVAILDDLLAYVKAEAGEYILTPAPFAPRAVVETVLAQVQPTADARGLRCTFTIADSVPTRLSGDEATIGRVLLAMLWNAVSFTPAGEVRVESAWAARDGWIVTVRDTGPGIAPEAAARLFEPFWRGEDRPQVPTAGCGLGLAMARSLARAMQGDLSLIESGSQGSAFCLWLPVLPNP